MSYPYTCQHTRSTNYNIVMTYTCLQKCIASGRPFHAHWQQSLPGSSWSRAPLPADRIHQTLHPGEKSPKRLVKSGISKTRCSTSSTNTRTSSKLCSYMVRNLSPSEQLLAIPPFFWNRITELLGLERTSGDHSTPPLRQG